MALATVIPQPYTEQDVSGTEYLAARFWVTCPVSSFPRLILLSLLMTLLLHDTPVWHTDSALTSVFTEQV